MADQELCERCRNIPFDMFLGEKKTYELARTRSELRESARHCVACKFWNTGCGTDVFWNGVAQNLDDYSISLSSYDDLEIQIAGQYRRSGRSGGVSEPLYCWAETKSGNGKGSRGIDYRYYRSSSLSDESADLMRALVDDCSKSHTHPLCNGPKSFLDIPSRLLFVGSVDASPQLRLVTTSDLSEVPAYVALSHCWGNVAKDAPWKLTQNNMTGFEHAIPESLLPRTFLDAVKITRGLRESYIWIDSICILQDCAADWECESEKMAGIYNNSLCTLGSASDSAQGGCVGLRSRRALSTVRLPAGAVTFYEPVHRENERNLPITKRAWCLQERELAKRFIQFTDQGFLWFCGHHCVSEYNYLGSACSAEAEVPILSLYQNNSTVGRLSHRLLPIADDSVSSGQGLGWSTATKETVFYNYWYHLVQEYMERDITHSSDRLPAIAGLAQRMAKHFPSDSYVSGLWLSELKNGLLWQAKDRKTQEPYPATAPSWSWAAPNVMIDFEHKYRYFDEPGLYGERRAPTFTVLFDPDKDVSHFPVLKAEGSLIHAKAVQGGFGYYDLQICDKRLSCIKPWINYGLGQALDKKHPGSGELQTHVLCDFKLTARWDWSIESYCLGEMLYCLVFATVDRDDTRRPRGLILKCVDSSKRLYKRMGMFGAWDGHAIWTDKVFWGGLVALERETIYIK